MTQSAAGHLSPHHLYAHALGFTNQVLHPSLAEIALAPLQGVGIKVDVQVCL